jgi:hypothetical protein
MLILIPFPLFFASTIYGVGGLTAWVVIGIIWCFCSAFAVVLYPLWESRVAIAQIARGVIKVRIFGSHFMYDSDLLLLPKDLFASGSGKHVAHGPSSGA